jgi:hypothetical protein
MGGIGRYRGNRGAPPFSPVAYEIIAGAAQGPISLAQLIVLREAVAPMFFSRQNRETLRE